MTKIPTYAIIVSYVMTRNKTMLIDDLSNHDPSFPNVDLDFD